MKLKVWSPDTTVKVERNPYTYVLQPTETFSFIPFLYACFAVLRNILEERNLDTSKVDRITEYLASYTNLSVERDEDMKEARKIRKEYGSIFQEK
jgi:hypothetical protein